MILPDLVVGVRGAQAVGGGLGQGLVVLGEVAVGVRAPQLVVPLLTGEKQRREVRTRSRPTLPSGSMHLGSAFRELCECICLYVSLRACLPACISV